MAIEVGKIAACHTWKIFAECETEEQESDCVEAKKQAKSCMKIIGNAVPEVEVGDAVTTLKEADGNTDAETETTAANDASATST